MPQQLNKIKKYRMEGVSSHAALVRMPPAKFVRAMCSSSFKVLSIIEEIVPLPTAKQSYEDFFFEPV